MSRTNYPNQFGFDLGEVKNTVSALKTAKIRQKKMERENDVNEKSDEAFGNYLSKNSPGDVVNAIDENEDGAIDASEKKNALISTGRKFGAYNKTQRVEERKSEVSSRNNRRNVLNAATNRADNRASAKHQQSIEKVEKANIAKKTFIDQMEKYENGIGMPANVVKVNKAARESGETPLSGKNLDYGDNVKVDTLLKTIDGVGKSFMKFETPEQGNTFIAEGTDRYMKASDPDSPEYNPAVATRTKEVLDLLPKSFKVGDDVAMSEFQQFKGHLVADLTTKQQDIKSNYAEKQERKQLTRKKSTPKDLSLTKGQQATINRASAKTIANTIEDDDQLFEKFKGKGKEKLQAITETQKYMKDNNVGVQEAMAKVLYKDEKKKKKFVEGKIYEQNGVKYKYENGKFKPQK